MFEKLLPNYTVEDASTNAKCKEAFGRLVNGIVLQSGGIAVDEDANGPALSKGVDISIADDDESEGSDSNEDNGDTFFDAAEAVN